MKQYRWLVALIVSALVVGLAYGNPVVYNPWTSGDAAFECGRIGDFEYAFKVDDAAPNGSWTHEGNTITILNSDGSVFDWSATVPISAVIVKAGTGANVWFYDPAAYSDSGLYGYEEKGVSHVTFCWNGDDDFEQLVVTKTAVTTYTREHFWDIDKKVETENGHELDGFAKIWLFIDGSGDETATWTVDVTYEGYEDSGWNVSGTITIENTGTLDAVITSVDDVLGGTSIDVDCGVEFPYTLPVGETLTCSYSEDGYVEGFNEVTVTTERDAYFADAEIVWGDPTTEINETVNVKDISDLFGEVALGTVTAPNGDSSPTTRLRLGGLRRGRLRSLPVRQHRHDRGDRAGSQRHAQGQRAVLRLRDRVRHGRRCDLLHPHLQANWGWTNPIEPGFYTWDLWAGAAQCDTSKGALVGSVSVEYDQDGYVDVDFLVGAPYLLEEEHVYAGYDMFPPTGIAPGRYTNNGPFDGSEVYVIAHAVVGMPDPSFGP
jgi:hypothetical protein